MSLIFLSTRFQCTWPWSTLVMLCDGRIVCGCAKARTAIACSAICGTSRCMVWTGSTVTGLRESLNGGGAVLRQLPKAAARENPRRLWCARSTPAPSIPALYQIRGL